MRNLVKWIYAFMIVAILAAVAFGSCGKKTGTADPNRTVPPAVTAASP